MPGCLCKVSARRFCGSSRLHHNNSFRSFSHTQYPHNATSIYFHGIKNSLMISHTTNVFKATCIALPTPRNNIQPTATDSRAQSRKPPAPTRWRSTEKIPGTEMQDWRDAYPGGLHVPGSLSLLSVIRLSRHCAICTCVTSGIRD